MWKFRYSLKAKVSPSEFPPPARIRKLKVASERQETLSRLSQREVHENVFYSDTTSDLSPICMYDLRVTHVVYFHHNVYCSVQSKFPKMNPDNVLEVFCSDRPLSAFHNRRIVNWIQAVREESPEHRILVHNNIDSPAAVIVLISMVGDPWLLVNLKNDEPRVCSILEKMYFWDGSQNHWNALVKRRGQDPFDLWK